MSESTPFGTNDPTRLNQASGHDTGLYDPSVHDNQIVAMYDTDAEARAARDKLVASGVPAGSIQLVAKEADAGTLGGVNAEDQNGGVWAAISSMFAPESDRSAYSHAIGRGHAMLLVTPGQGSDRTSIIHTLESTNPVDFDARLEEWRQAGYDTSTVHQDYAPSTAAAPMPAMTATPKVAAAGTVMAAPLATGAVATDADTIQVMEERLRVGKREVAAGAVRIRSYVVERPVQEQVRLHEERISVERRPVDRPATPGDLHAFEERVIEARATSEEAVIEKEARVVEEIGLKKETSERTETVHDTVRKTEVEIIDDTTKVGSTSKAGGASTAGATSSGMNKPGGV